MLLIEFHLPWETVWKTAGFQEIGGYNNTLFLSPASCPHTHTRFETCTALFGILGTIPHYYHNTEVDKVHLSPSLKHRIDWTKLTVTYSPQNRPHN